MGRLFDRGPDEDYWFSDLLVKDIRAFYNMEQGEMFSRCPVKILEEIKPSWVSQKRKTYDWGGVCHNCGQPMEVNSRPGFMLNSASCPSCGHYVTHGCLSNCGCPWCVSYREIEKQKKEDKDKKSQEKWNNEHTCFICNQVKDDVVRNAIPGRFVCRECFLNWNDITLSEKWGDKPDAIKPIFDSEPERWTFSIIRTSYPNLILIPNAALLSFIDLDAISPSLSEKEIDYLYKGRIDLLIVEPANYKPILAIELDSSWHDNGKVQRNDNRKEKILSLTGLPLERFRQNGFSTFGEIETTLNAYFGRGEK